MTASYLYTAIICNILILIVLFLMAYKKVLKYKLAAKHEKLTALNEKRKMDTYKQAGAFIERINRATRSMDVDECHSIEMILEDEVKHIVFSALHPNTKALYLIIVADGLSS